MRCHMKHTVKDDTVNAQDCYGSLYDLPSPVPRPSEVISTGAERTAWAPLFPHPRNWGAPVKHRILL